MRNFITAAALLGVVLLCAPARADQLVAGAPRNTFNINDTFVSGLTQVTSLRFIPDGRLLIGEKTGAVKLRLTDGTVQTLHTFPVDTASEKGVLGVAPQPDFMTSNRVVVYWSVSNGAGGSSSNRHRIASYMMANNAGTYTLDTATERILVENVLGPANHDGGGLTFGPDGYLYVGTGDTGCNETPPTMASGELHRNLLSTAFNYANGKVLRVDVMGNAPNGNPYTTATNVSGITANPLNCSRVAGTDVPITTDPARAEIWALGFRNAFRIWADPQTGFIWVGDVGESRYEEIDVITGAGGHFGYPFIEGPETASTWPLSKCSELSPNPGNCIPPAHICRHTSCAGCVTADSGCNSITGGIILDACQVPAPFRGQYVYADNVTRNMWTMEVTPARDGLVAGTRANFASFDELPVEMTEGPDGALYVAVSAFPGAGRIVRISPQVPETCGGSSSSSSSSSSAAASSSSSAAASSSSAAAASSSSSGGASSSSAAASSSGGAASSSSSAAAGSSSSSAAASASSSAAGSSSTSSSGGASGGSSGAMGTSSSAEEGEQGANGCGGCVATRSDAPIGLMLLGLLLVWRRPRR